MGKKGFPMGGAREHKVAACDDGVGGSNPLAPILSIELAFTIQHLALRVFDFKPLIASY